MIDDEHCTEPYQITIETEPRQIEGTHQKISVQAPNKEDVLELFEEAQQQ